MGLFSGIASAVGGIASTILGNNSAKHEAQRNRDWQEDMSNTSIQRRVADLKAAGLNPLLAVSNASSGASTPTGGQANLKHFDPATITTMMNGLSSAKLTQAQAKAQEQENSIFDLKADALRIQNDLMKKKIWTEQLEQGLKAAQTDAERAKLLTEAYKRANIHASTEEITRKAQLLGIQYDYYKNGVGNKDFISEYPGFVEGVYGSKSSFPALLGLGLGKNSADSVRRQESIKSWFLKRFGGKK